MSRLPRSTAHLAGRALLALAPVAPAAAQAATDVTFSVDWQGPLMGQPAPPQGAPVTEADLLFQSGAVFGPGTPGIRLPGSFLQRYGACIGHPPGVSCGVEVDALSFGIDARLRPLATYRFDLLFSVDEHAVGAPVPLTPSVASEAAADEAAGDVFVRRLLGAGPFPPGPGSNVGVLDGDGRRSANGALYPGLGLAEPTRSDPTVPELGDNLDALDVGPPPGPGSRIYFSLEGGLPDPLEPGVQIIDSSRLQPDPQGQFTLTGADVLVVDVGSTIVSRYASADQLGLDSNRLDDIDAVLVVENGIPGYQPSLVPYDWVQGGTGQKDLVLFSVRRGSRIIGQLDSALGLPITEGDVLGPPIGGGMLGTNPSIFVAAEVLGLETMRGQSISAGDDLNALDTRDDTEDPIKDCNHNGIEDAIDIATGSSVDHDANGIPDECEDPGDAFCDCDTTAEAPCGNVAGPGEGCVHVAGAGGRLRGTGTSSVETDSLVLRGTQLPANTFALVFMGDGTTSGFPPLSNGRICIAAGMQGVYRLAVFPSGTGGAFTMGPGIIGVAGGVAPAASLAVGTTWSFQTWYRDVGGPCGGLSNLTNAWRVTFTP